MSQDVHKSQIFRIQKLSPGLSKPKILAMSILGAIFCNVVACGTPPDHVDVKNGNSGQPGSPADQAKVASTNPSSIGLSLGSDDTVKIFEKKLNLVTGDQRGNNDFLAEQIKKLDFDFNPTSLKPTLTTELTLKSQAGSLIQSAELMSTSSDSPADIILAPVKEANSVASDTPDTQIKSEANTKAQSVIEHFVCQDPGYDASSECETAVLSVQSGLVKPGLQSATVKESLSYSVLRHTALDVSYAATLAPAQPSHEYQELQKALAHSQPLSFAIMDSAEVIHGTSFVRITIGLPPDPTTKKIKVIALSGYAEKKNIDTTPAAGSTPVTPLIGGDLKWDLRNSTLQNLMDSSGHEVDNSLLDLSLASEIATASIINVTTQASLRVVLHLGAANEDLTLDLNRKFAMQVKKENSKDSTNDAMSPLNTAKHRPPPRRSIPVPTSIPSSANTPATLQK